MTARTIDVMTTADREITATRVFDAPRELVWKAWTDPKHVAQWWGPTGFTNTISEMDVRPGGVWRFVMHGPDGRDYNNKIVYIEVVKPERLVYDHVSGPQFHVTVTFAEEGSKTKVNVRMLFESGALRDKVAEEFGAVEGLSQTLGRLAEHLTKSSGERVVNITRVFDAPRTLVFKAWTDPKQMAQWWGPHGFTNPVCEIDARPGGAIRIDMRGPDGVVYPMKGTFHEIVPPERLVFTSSAFEDTDGNPQIEVLNTVTFADANGKTRVTLRAAVVKSTPEVATALAGMKEGWTQSLERLEGFVESTDRMVVITRIFDAPRELVFKAWTEPEHLMRWWAPKDFTTPFCEVDLRPGGVFHFCMRSPEGLEFWGRGVYREVVELERIVYTDSFADEKGDPVEPARYGMSPNYPSETLVTVTFTEHEGKTKVTLRHAVLESVPERAGIQQGWSEMFDRLAEELAKA